MVSYTEISATYTDTYFYRYLDQMFLFNRVIKPQYQETKQRTTNPKNKDLLPGLGSALVCLCLWNLPHVEMIGH